MSTEQLSATVRVEALAPEFSEAASAWAARLKLPMAGDARFALQLGVDGLQLNELAVSGQGPVRADFIGGAVAHRRLYGGGSGQMIAKAVGIQPGIRPSVLDATAGLGRDAFVLAMLGCTVSLIERQPLVCALLEDALQRAQTVAELAPIVARMHLLSGDAIDVMGLWSGDAPQVIYLDPMFPERDKSALVKKEMRLFKPIVGADDDAPQLLAAALSLATHRVVVKRPRKAPAIAGAEPGYVLEGNSSRFDIYPKKALKSKA